MRRSSDVLQLSVLIVFLFGVIWLLDKYIIIITCLTEFCLQHSAKKALVHPPITMRGRGKRRSDEWNHKTNCFSFVLGTQNTVQLLCTLQRHYAQNLNIAIVAKLLNSQLSLLDNESM